MRSFGIRNAAPWASAPAVGAAGDLYWNTATKTLYVSDGAAWIAAANQWGIVGNNLTPLDGTKGVAVPATGNLTALTLGGRTVKARVITDTANNNVRLSLNDALTATPGWVQDDVSLPSWVLSLFGDAGTDALDVARSAPGGAFASTLLQLAKTGDLSLASSEGTARAVTTFVVNSAAVLGANSTATFTLAAFPIGILRAGRVYRLRAAGGFFRAAGTFNIYVLLQNGGNQLAAAPEATIAQGTYLLDVQIIYDGAGGLTTIGQIVTVTRGATGPVGGTGGTFYTIYNQFGAYTPLPGNSFSIGGQFTTASASNAMNLVGAATMEVL